MATASDVVMRGSEAPARALPAEAVRDLYRAMARARLLDERMAQLVEEGRIGLHPRAHGLEAAIVGAAMALREGDWIFPGPRDFGAALARGMRIAHYLHHVFGTSQDSLSGRPAPGGFSGRDYGLGSASAPAATHLPHAVGFAWAARQRGEDVVTAAFFDGAEIDAADFHTGLNFAGVWKAPTLFVCRVQSGQSAASHAVAYGLAQARCDGDDILAVHDTVSGALTRAQRGEGATVIDLEVGSQDPLRRARTVLEQLGAWGAEDEQALLRETHAEVDAALAEIAHTARPEIGTMFGVHAELPAHLAEQLAQARR